MDHTTLRKLKAEYRNAETRQEQRRIEDAVLEEVLWDGEKIGGDSPFAEYTEEEWERIKEFVSEDAPNDVRRLLRKPYLSGLSEDGRFDHL